MKHPSQSKTIISAVIGLATTLLVAKGILSQSEAETALGLILELSGAIVTAATFIGVIYGRWKANTPLKL